MKRVAVGEKAPGFSLPNQHAQKICLEDFKGEKSIVLFFYPADESPICTREACAFRDAYQDFNDAGAVVIGISSDKIEKHQIFASNHQLPFHLLSDNEGSLRKAFGVPRSLGLLPGRVTYVIDPRGIVRHLFSAQFSAERHVQEALKIVYQIEKEESQ